MQKKLTSTIIVSSLQSLQRQRHVTVRSRIMLLNRIAACVAVHDGYQTGMEEEERKAAYAAAQETVKMIQQEELTEHPLLNFIKSSLIAVESFEAQEAVYEKQMEQLAKQHPLADWVAHADQRGLGMLSFAKVVGEVGDFSNYPNPAKVWKRMGCAPYEVDGVVHSAATWKSKGLSAEDWVKLGYNPRRRSLMWLIGDNLIKQNKSVYRARYDETKARAKVLHDDWTPLHCHNHGRLLASKLLLKNLWIVWTNGGATLN